MRKSWESHKKKSRERYEKVMRKSWEIYALIQLQACLFLSVQLKVTLSRPELVAARPWLAFQAKAMLTHLNKTNLVSIAHPSA